MAAVGEMTSVFFLIRYIERSWTLWVSCLYVENVCRSPIPKSIGAVTANDYLDGSSLCPQLVRIRYIVINYERWLSVRNASKSMFRVGASGNH